LPWIWRTATVCLVQAYPAESSEAFCEGYNVSFEFFGGVPCSILYDNTWRWRAILGDGKRLRTRRAPLAASFGKRPRRVLLPIAAA
jgi:hypothetical protein